ncbi:peptide chain release factor-like protein [Penicillium cataractarum]|uniref:Peptide chain release factor-like protein n=1 Tax=Penicillium cataractarum TaxID=2100454 RepID=A0A9W9V6N0_9EURO|nr:peptide chain release factor-like protein [Penicillium cataractarum]KAJ5368216.1 peptide chain release factor-like protein [Penicillium cataractarum]
MIRSQLWSQLSRGSSTQNALLSPYTLLLPHRTFSQTPFLPAKPLPARLKINDADLTVSYLKGTGPGGQKINKTNSAVQIIHAPSGIVVKCQATRSRSQNEKMARSLLADRVEAREKGDQSRVALKAEAARKKKASKVKKARRKYRDLEKGAEEGVSEGLEQEADGDVETEVEVEVEKRTTGKDTSEKGPST